MNHTPRHTNPDRQTSRGPAARTRPKDARPSFSARRAVATLLCLALLIPLFATGGARTQAALRQAEVKIEGAPAQPLAAARVNFAEVAAQDSAEGKDAFALSGAAAAHVEPPPAPPEPESEWKPAAAMPATKSQPRASKSATGSLAKSAETSAASRSGAQPDPATASAVGDESRAPAANFVAQTDSGTHAPPDTSGAVGLNMVLSTTRANYVVQHKPNGVLLSSISAEDFWAPTGASGIYNSRALFDPGAQRWLISAASNARSAASSVLLAVSEDSDPQGGFFLYRFDADENDLLWADYVSVGFNVNWVAVTFNAHNLSNDGFNHGVVLAVSRPHLLWEGTTPTRRFGVANAQGGFSMQPAVTYSQWELGNYEIAEQKEYLVSHVSSGAAVYRVSWLEGTPLDPTLVIGVQKTNGLGGWSQPGGEILPQAPDSLGTGTRKIEAPDPRVQKVVFRNGSIYYCQTVGLPAGPAGTPIQRTAAQWTRVDANGDFVEGGRVEDPAATPTNGGKWYAYPSLSVNRLGDVIIGFTEFASNQFASAGYAVRVFDDPWGTTRLPRVYRTGLGHYERALPGARNLWGLYSNAQVDPSNDLDLWTIQEYANPPSGVGPGSGRWATRWAKVVPPSTDRIAFVSNRDGDDEIYVMEADGSHVRRMTFDPGQDTSPTWSPDRTRIAYTHYGPAGPEIRIVLADGSDVYFLTFGSEPSWSPGGNAYLAFVRGIDIWTHLLGDGEEINVTNNNEEGGYYHLCCHGWSFYDTSPSWSPDEQTIVFEGVIEDTRRIFKIPYYGGQRTLINGGDGITGPDWSPDGTEIAYTDYGKVCTMNPDGTNRVCSASLSAHGPAWSPDSQRIVFGRNNGGNIELFVMNRDFTGQTNLTNSPASNDWDPAW